jgi:hypothetical protein
VYYLYKYVGRFRVRNQVYLDGKTSENHDDTFVKCNNGIEMYRYKDGVLALYVPTPNRSIKLFNLFNQYLTEETKSKIEYEINNSNTGSLSGEHVLLFYEKYIDEIVKIIKPEIKGKNIIPKGMSKDEKLIIKSRKNSTHSVQNMELVLEFKNKVASILGDKKCEKVIENNCSDTDGVNADVNGKMSGKGKIGEYRKLYSWLGEKMGIDLWKESRSNGLKVVEVLDCMGRLEDAIGELDWYLKFDGVVDKEK